MSDKTPGTNGRILMLLENNGYPGDTRVRREALALVDEGFSVTVIAPREEEEELGRDIVDGVVIYRYPPPPENDSVIGFIWEYFYSTLAALVLSFRVWIRSGFDVIHAHSPPDTLFVVGVFFKLLGKRFVFDHHDLSPELYRARSSGAGNPLLYRILLLLEWMTFKSSDMVVATNESYKDIALKRGGVREEKIIIVRNGPPLSIMGFEEPIPEIVSSKKTILGYAGAIGRQDGLDYLIEALYHLREDLGRNDFYCYIMGDGDDLPRIKSLAEEKQMLDVIAFTGWLQADKLGRYLSSIDIGVDPDPSNPFNDRCTMIKMTEYMAYSKPIVAFDLPEHRYTAQGSALYVSDNSPLKFATAIQTLMDDPLKRKHMGQLARERVVSDIAWEYSVPHLVNGYHRLFGRSTTMQTKASQSVDGHS